MPPGPAIITPTLLQSLRTHPRLPQNTWYFITGVTLSALNRPDEVPKVFTHALETTSSGPSQQTQSAKEHLHIARRMREALVKSTAIVGLPKTINALLALKQATPPPLLDTPLSYTPTNRPIDLHATTSSILQRGQSLFDSIYGKISQRVMSQMDNSGTEDLGLVARVAYGYILSGGDKVLAPVETSFVLLAGLVPMDVNPQLKGHLKGALNNGATVEEVMAVREVVVGVCEAAGMRRLEEGERSGWGWREDVAGL